MPSHHQKQSPRCLTLLTCQIICVSCNQTCMLPFLGIYIESWFEVLWPSFVNSDGHADLSARGFSLFHKLNSTRLSASQISKTSRLLISSSSKAIQGIHALCTSAIFFIALLYEMHSPLTGTYNCRSRGQEIIHVDWKHALQVNGHFMAKLDPLKIDARPTPIELDPTLYGFSDKDLDRE